MALYFLASSAIIKRYVAESGHAWIADLCDPARGHDVHIAQVALVEVVAALLERVLLHPALANAPLRLDQHSTAHDNDRGDTQIIDGLL